MKMLWLFFQENNYRWNKKPPKICSSGDDIAAFQKAQPNPATV
jgi:hypothetical protein